jgi:hypothetical protein
MTATLWERRVPLAVALALLLASGCSDPEEQPSRAASELHEENPSVVTSNREIAPLAAHAPPVEGNLENQAGPFRATIAVNGPAFAVGESPVVRFSIQNIGDKKADIWNAGFWPNHRVHLVDQDQQAVQLTDFGKQCLAAFSPGGARDKNVQIPLSPGEVYDRYQPIALNRMFKLVPGNYRVQVEYQELNGANSTHVYSNQLRFQITGAGGGP